MAKTFRGRAADQDDPADYLPEILFVLMPQKQGVAVERTDDDSHNEILKEVCEYEQNLQPAYLTIKKKVLLQRTESINE